MCAGTVYLTECTVLSTEHEASVTAVGVSEDGMKILAATASVSYLHCSSDVFTSSAFIHTTFFMFIKINIQWNQDTLNRGHVNNQHTFLSQHH